MASDLGLSDDTVNAGIAAIAARLDGGSLRLYDGTRPVDANTAVTTQRLLSTVTYSAQAFGAPAGGVVTANPIGPDPSIAQSGHATWARGMRSDGTTVAMDFNVGTSGCDVNLDSVDLQAGQTLTLTSQTLQLPKRKP